MSKKKEIAVLVIADVLAFFISSFILYFLQTQSTNYVSALQKDPFELYVFIGLTFFWLVVFLFAGLYRSWYRTSFFDELVLVFKSIGLGSVFLILLTTIEFIRIHPVTPAKLIVFLYILILLTLIMLGRVFVRMFHKKILLHGIGRRNAVIIGWNQYSQNLCKQIRQSPELGYDILGFLKVRNDSPEDALDSRMQSLENAGHFMYLTTYRKVQQELQSLENARLSDDFSESKDVLGTIGELPELIRTKRISEVLIVLDPSEHKLLLDIVTMCDEVRDQVLHPISLKIIPDLYNIISGQARTTQIEGIPLIELEPEIMPIWEQNLKRLMDISVSLSVLILLIPFWIVVGLAVKITSKGPVFYRQERVGRHGKPFQIIKFRSMRTDAESLSGPALATKNDPRVTPIGGFLRKSRIDEFPQFLNVLKGDMSIVGPRPEREFFVKQVVKKAPQFVHLHRVRPGITSLGQVKYGYAGNIDEIIERMKFDILYIENMSLRMDFKIIFYTVYVMLMGRGR